MRTLTWHNRRVDLAAASRAAAEVLGGTVGIRVMGCSPRHGLLTHGKAMDDSAALATLESLAALKPDTFACARWVTSTTLEGLGTGSTASLM